MKKRSKIKPTPPYRSRYEEAQAKLLKKSKVIFDYEEESYNFFMPADERNLSCKDCDGTTIQKTVGYTPDFKLYYKGSRKKRFIIVETKGKMNAAIRRKYEAFTAQYPAIDFRLCFMANNKIHKNSATRYADWADKVGIPYCVGNINTQWLNELGY